MTSYIIGDDASSSAFLAVAEAAEHATEQLAETLRQLSLSATTLTDCGHRLTAVADGCRGMRAAHQP